MKKFGWFILGSLLSFSVTRVWAWDKMCELEEDIDAQRTRADQAWEYADAAYSGGRWICIYSQKLGRCAYRFLPKEKQDYIPLGDIKKAVAKR